MGVLAFVMILTGLSVYLYARFDNNITRIDTSGLLGAERPAKPKVAGPTKPMNVLVLGSDTRKGAGNNIGGKTEGLSDTTIMLHLSQNRRRAYGVSIPRDAMVKRPKCQTAKGRTDPGGLSQFNDAYKVGGAVCTLKTVEKMTDIRFDHVVVVDFNGFKHMVDALGGVEMCVPTEVDDYTGNIHLDAGTYNMDGKTALDYVRVRHGISANGDIGRMKRQQTFIAAMVNKLVSVNTLVNPIKLTRFLDAATKSLTTDEDFSVAGLAGVAKSLRDIGLDKVEFITAPWEPYPPDTNRVQLTADATKLWRRIRLDKSLGPQFSSEVVRASDTVPGTKAKGAKKGTKKGAKAGKKNGPATPVRTMSPEERQQMAAENGLCS